MESLRRTCATVPQQSELRFGVVRAVGRGIAVLDRGLHRAREGEVLAFLFPIFTMVNAILLPTVKCFRFVFENLTTFSSANILLESSIRALFGDILCFQIKVGVYDKLAKKK